jgi:hypothetical protein
MSAIPFIPDQPAAQAHASLRRSLRAMDRAQECAVLWFAEIMGRHLYRKLGYSSINQYAIQKLGFSKSRTGDFIRLARQLDVLPGVRKALSSGELGYTKAREILPVATPETEDDWLKAAKGSRRELVLEVKKARQAAKVDPAQGELLPAAPSVVGAKELPVRFQLTLTPEQEARRAALAALVETKEKTPRGVLASRPPVQIHVHESEGRMTVQTHAGEREMGRADSERICCDATICENGKRNTTTVPPRIRRQVLGRDRHRCQAPGCDRTRFLEVHHLTPRSRGGGHHPDNLITLCGSCHRLWHERKPDLVRTQPAI